MHGLGESSPGFTVVFPKVPVLALRKALDFGLRFASLTPWFLSGLQKFEKNWRDLAADENSWLNFEEDFMKKQM